MTHADAIKTRMRGVQLSSDNDDDDKDDDDDDEDFTFVKLLFALKLPPDRNRMAHNRPPVPTGPSIFDGKARVLHSLTGPPGE